MILRSFNLARALEASINYICFVSCYESNCATQKARTVPLTICAFGVLTHTALPQTDQDNVDPRLCALCRCRTTMHHSVLDILHCGVLMQVSYKHGCRCES